jgi:2-polyprenyl-3-methyl-5-hydroxy-6-metoxy-1,4-benzoquinol methylase
MTGDIRSKDPCLLCGDTRHGSTFVFQKDSYVLGRCKSCDLVSVTNPPDAVALAELYSFSSNYHRTYTSESNARLHRRRARRQRRFLERHVPPGRLLDVGCSAGYFLAEARRAGWKVSGLEMSPDTAALALALHDVDVVIGTLGATDGLPLLSYDVITLWDVIEHVPDPLATLRRVHALLAHGGLVAIQTPNIDGLFPKASYLVAEALDHWPHPEPPGHLYQFSSKTLTRLMHATGFRVESVEHTSIPLAYSFGDWTTLLRSPKRLAYAATFAPLAALGPRVRMGDALLVVAKKA